MMYLPRPGPHPCTPNPSASLLHLLPMPCNPHHTGFAPYPPQHHPVYAVPTPALIFPPHPSLGSLLGGGGYAVPWLPPLQELPPTKSAGRWSLCLQLGWEEGSGFQGARQYLCLPLLPLPHSLAGGGGLEPRGPPHIHLLVGLAGRRKGGICAGKRPWARVDSLLGGIFAPQKGPQAQTLLPAPLLKVCTHPSATSVRCEQVQRGRRAPPLLMLAEGGGGGMWTQACMHSHSPAHACMLPYTCAHSHATDPLVHCIHDVGVHALASVPFHVLWDMHGAVVTHHWCDTCMLA